MRGYILFKIQNFCQFVKYIRYVNFILLGSGIGKILYFLKSISDNRKDFKLKRNINQYKEISGKFYSE